MQQGSRNQNSRKVCDNSSDISSASSVSLNVSKDKTDTSIKDENSVLPKRQLVTHKNVLQCFAEIHSFCILGKRFLFSFSVIFLMHAFIEGVMKTVDISNAL